jgi:hypothetical protein
MIDEHGLHTMLDVITAVDKYHVRSYCNAQNSYKLCMCLLDYITREAFLRINTDAEQYLIGATEDHGGVCFLLLFIQSITVHTRARVKTIQKNLYTLDSHMVKVDYKLKSSTNMSSSNAKHVPWGISNQVK